MKFTKESLITGFALFALFFGAGNLILPPYLGFISGSSWYLVALGFLISAVILPLLGIIAHAKIQGSMFDFSNKVSPIFSLIFCILIYGISVALPAPRTAAVTYEIAIAPFFNINALSFSCLYFGLVFLFVIKRNAILNNIGKYLTPAIFILLLIILAGGIFKDQIPTNTNLINPLLTGFFEGYQTFDAIAALVVGGVLVVSVKKKANLSQLEIKKLITTAAIIAALGLIFIYCALIYNGALHINSFAENSTRAQILLGLATLNVGSFAQVALSLLVGLACFTTAIGIITGTADFIKDRFPSKYVYQITVFLACITGILMGSFSVDAIIKIAFPVLLLIYPVTIVLIILNVLPLYLRTAFIMRAVVITTLIFNLPYAIALIWEDFSISFFQDIPFSANQLGWVIPVFIMFLIAVAIQSLLNKRTV